jgi:hypothetical protein
MFNEIVLDFEMTVRLRKLCDNQRKQGRRETQGYSIKVSELGRGSGSVAVCRFLVDRVGYRTLVAGTCVHLSICSNL